MRIVFNDVSYSYSLGTPFVHKALDHITTEIEEGTYVAVIGQTGSGKSTLLQHLNALILPTEGSIVIGDREIIAGQKMKNLKSLRKKVGIVFQFPEHQLFEETVLKDIMFGPMNFGVSKEEAERRARELIHLVGLPEEVLEKSPFDLSGGQMRRVAIAGVLAMDPEVIVLDEPTAGLDPRGQKEMMDMFYELHKKRNLTTILVTHSMEDAARYAEEIIVMHEGECVLQGAPRILFADEDTLKQYRLQLPRVVKLQKRLEKQMETAFSKICLTEEELAKEVARSIKGREQA